MWPYRLARGNRLSAGCPRTSGISNSTYLVTTYLVTTYLVTTCTTFGDLLEG